MSEQELILSEENMSLLHLLSMDSKYLAMLEYLYNTKDTDKITPHKMLGEKFNWSKSNGSYHIRKLVQADLIYKQKSKVYNMILGYKITAKGIKFYEMYVRLAQGVVSQCQ